MAVRLGSVSPTHGSALRTFRGRDAHAAEDGVLTYALSRGDLGLAQDVEQNGKDAVQWQMTLCVAVGVLMTLPKCLAGQELEHSELLQGTMHSTRASRAGAAVRVGDYTGAGLTHVYQRNVHGGLSTSRLSLSGQ